MIPAGSYCSGKVNKGEVNRLFLIEPWNTY